MATQAIHFPGPQAETTSPDHRYVVQNVNSDGMEPAHVLFLRDTEKGSKVEIHSYDRHVDLLWSPRSDAFVVNDFEASDSARPLLYFLPWNGKRIDLLEELTIYLRGRHEENLVLKNDHVYLSVRRWNNPSELLCRLEAYGQANPQAAGFKGYYSYKIGEGFRVYNSHVQLN